MLRGLRRSNSVCGRIIQKENFSLNDNTNDLAGEDEQTLQDLNESNPTERKRKRRIVEVLDVAESARCGHEKFIPFTERLHPWTTIKVSAFPTDFGFKSLFKFRKTPLSPTSPSPESKTRLRYAIGELIPFTC